MRYKLQAFRRLPAIYYVTSFITGLIACLPVCFLAYMVFVMLTEEPVGGRPDMGPILVSFSTLAISIAITTVLGVLFTLILIVTGRLIALRRHYTLCLIGAAIICFALPPLGTALGIVTLILLLSPEVKELFDDAEGAWA